MKNKKYKEAAELVRDSLFLKCYDRENGRFFQGINGGVPDKAWALDCTTWAGTLIFSVVHSSTAEACLENARSVYLTKDKKIIQSREKDYYNTAYSDDETFSGFKPYSNKTADYKVRRISCGRKERLDTPHLPMCWETWMRQRNMWMSVSDCRTVTGVRAA